MLKALTSLDIARDLSANQYQDYDMPKPGWQPATSTDAHPTIQGDSPGGPSPQGVRGGVRVGFPSCFLSASYHRGVDTDVGMVQGRHQPPPAPIQSDHRPHDNGLVRAVPAHPISGPAYPHGSDPIPH